MLLGRAMKHALWVVMCLACGGEEDAGIDRVLEHPRAELSWVKLKVANGEDPWTACLAARGTASHIPASAGAEGRALAAEIHQLCTRDLARTEVEKFLARTERNPDPIVMGCGTADLWLSALVKHHEVTADIVALQARYNRRCPK